MTSLPFRIRIALLALCAAASPALSDSISEETPPITCGNQLLAGISCSGKFCDNIQPICGSGRYAIDDIFWTRFGSEEGRGEVSCEQGGPGERAYIAGLACNGKYCDNLALECVTLEERSRSRRSRRSRDCDWTDWISEERGSLRFPRGYAAVTLACRGKYCDDKSFLICPVDDRGRERRRR
ncbi:MAG: hypothetical protein AAF725_05305 [Acidobacteriota bacterium]